MFSRKKNDLLLVSDHDEGRAFFRVEPSSKEPIDVSIVGNRYQMKFIGDGGIGLYRGEGRKLESGEVYSFKMILPIINEEISGNIRVVEVSERAVYSEFVGLSGDEAEKIHHFILEIQEKERRAFLRVEPSSKEPIEVLIGPNVYQIKDIGAGGIGIHREGDKKLEIGQEYPFKMSLPLIDEEISGIIRIVNISDMAYHCAFVEINTDDRERIHLMVLERQKEELRKKRKTYLK